MFLLQRSLCSSNFRKVGTVVSLINFFFQLVFLIILVIALYTLTKQRDVEDIPLEDLEFYRIPERNLVIDGLIFCLIEITFYAILIVGINKSHTGALLVWLIYSFVEFVIVQFGLLSLTILMSITYDTITTTLGYLSVIVQVLVAVYMIHNICVIYTLRQQIINRSILPTQINTNTVMNIPQTQSVPYASSSTHINNM